eukprot:TRINITY_DN2909_c0_g3_i1.p1 TRINITY_DN2909_c0_g3~~TRINITY_DN2909_c0_g3_i1.p1  ORF type:complete len:127 (-),score=28.83 TRINITY_DN2909_c0_g3_i1:191-523(-)
MAIVSTSGSEMLVAGGTAEVVQLSTEPEMSLERSKRMLAEIIKAMQEGGPSRDLASVRHEVVTKGWGFRNVEDMESCVRRLIEGSGKGDIFLKCNFSLYNELSRPLLSSA